MKGVINTRIEKILEESKLEESVKNDMISEIDAKLLSLENKIDMLTKSLEQKQEPEQSAEKQEESEESENEKHN